MNGDSTLEHIGLHLVQSLRRQNTAGIVDQDVQLRNGLRQRIYLRPILNIEPGVAIAGQVLVIVSRRAASAGDDHLGAGLAIGLRDRGSEAAGPACDENMRAGVIKCDIGPIVPHLAYSFNRGPGRH